MSADGQTVAIGAYLNDGNGSDAGHVRIYGWTDSAWIQVGADIDGEAGDDWSGRSVAMSAAGETVAIGAPQNDGNGSNSGHVRVYQLSSTPSSISATTDTLGITTKLSVPKKFVFGTYVALSFTMLTVPCDGCDVTAYVSVVLSTSVAFSVITLVVSSFVLTVTGGQTGVSLTDSTVMPSVSVVAEIEDGVELSW